MRSKLLVEKVKLMGNQYAFAPDVMDWDQEVTAPKQVPPKNSDEGTTDEPTKKTFAL